MSSTTGDVDRRTLANIERFSGFADLYDQHRPRAPALVVQILTQLSKEPVVDVVDIGCGTGLSTFVWSGQSQVVRSIIGVEPNNDMRTVAVQRLRSASAAQIAPVQNLRFVNGLSTATTLPDSSCDIVTASQSLHWMPPAETFAEVARILRPGGVFAAYDCDWPPTVSWEADVAYAEFMARVAAVEATLPPSAAHKWDKEQHVTRMCASNRFRFVKEIVLHSAERGDADRFVGLALSQGNVEAVLNTGISEEAIGVRALRDAVRRAMGDETLTFLFSYRMRIGIK